MKNRSILLLTLVLTSLTANEITAWGGGGAFAGGLVTGAVITSAANSNRQLRTQVVYTNSQSQPDNHLYCHRYPNAPECHQPIYRHHEHHYCNRHPNARECN